MRSIGFKYHGPTYNWVDLCDYCGTPWHRTDLNLDSDQLLRCHNCKDGKTLYEISIEKAAAVFDIKPVRGKKREGV
jgi:hypothetical protein